MPSANSASAYPVAMIQLLETVLNTGKRYAHTFETRKEAMRTRFRFYSLIKALRKSVSVNDKERAERLDALTFRIAETTLFIEHRDFTDEAKMFEQMLAEIQAQSATPPASASASASAPLEIAKAKSKSEYGFE